MNDNTRDQAPRFIEVQPDWSMAVRYWVRFVTSILKARNGVEQRTAERTYPLYSIAYGRNFAGAEWSARRAKMILEFGGSVVVPLWARQDQYVSAVGDVVTLDATTVRSPYKVGSYAYFEETGKTSVFRQLTAFAGSTITLEAGNAAYPDIAVPTYTNAAVVYPCIAGLRADNNAEWSADQVDETTEVIHVEES